MIDAGMIAGVIDEGIQGAGSAAGFLDTAQSAAARLGRRTPFAGMFQTMVQQTSALDKKASEAVTGLADRAGRGDSRRDDCDAEGRHGV